MSLQTKIKWFFKVQYTHAFLEGRHRSSVEGRVLQHGILMGRLNNVVRTFVTCKWG